MPCAMCCSCKVSASAPTEVRYHEKIFVGAASARAASIVRGAELKCHLLRFDETAGAADAVTGRRRCLTAGPQPIRPHIDASALRGYPPPIPYKPL
jgi:hypothetical protein